MSHCCAGRAGSRRPRRSTRSGPRSASPSARWTRRRRRSRPGSPSGSSRACSWRPWRRPASPLRRPRTWRGSRRASTHGAVRAGTSRVEPGDLVAFEAGVILGGYVGEVGRTHAVGRRRAVDRQLAQRWNELWDRLLAACRVGAPLSDLLDAYDAAGDPAPPDARGARAGARVRPPPRDGSAPADRRASSSSRRAWCWH